MLVCSGVALRLCRDKAWEITIYLRQGYGGQATNAPFSDRNKSFQTFLKTFEIASRTQTNFPVDTGVMKCTFVHPKPLSTESRLLFLFFQFFYDPVGNFTQSKQIQFAAAEKR